MSLRSPLSRVLGSGSAKEGTEHWWMQRVTAIGLLVLGIWFLLSLASINDFSHGELLGWVSRPSNAIMLLSLSAVLCWHSALGIQIVVEDYVHGSALKTISIILNKLVHLLLCIAAVVAVLKVALGTSA